jgi:hypothetical protein
MAFFNANDKTFYSELLNEKNEGYLYLPESDYTMLKSLYWYTLTSNADTEDVADNYILSSNSLYSILRELSGIDDYGTYAVHFLNDFAVGGKYPSFLFESYDSEYTVKTIDIGSEYTLNSEIIAQTFWEKLIGSSHTQSSQTFEGIKGIVAVTDDMLTGSAEDVCNRLYISTSDYDEFVSFYNSNKGNSTIYLLRYDTSLYFQMEVTEVGKKSGTWITSYNDTAYPIDTNAYFCQTNMYLDFDIIELEYKQGDTSITIPVISSPTEGIPELTPPIYTTTDKNPSDFWIYGIAVVTGLFALFVVYSIYMRSLQRRS